MTSSAPRSSDEVSPGATVAPPAAPATAEQDWFDDLTRLAAHICGTPIALVNLIDENRQWFKSRYGIAMTDLPRELTFCTHAIADDEAMLVVPDMSQDARFAAHPLVAGDAHIRFYAGMPLPGGRGAIGMLCVLDTVPRLLDAGQQAALADLSRVIVQQIELRRKLARAEGFFAGFAEHSPSPLWIKDRAGRYVMGNGALHDYFGVAQSGIAGKDDSHFWPPDIERELAQHDRQVLDSKQVLKTLETTDDGQRHWLVHRFPIDVDGEAFLGGSAIEMTTEVEKERALVRHDNFYVLLSRLTALISRAKTLEALCLETCRVAAVQPDIEIVDISRCDDAGGKLHLFASAGRDGAGRGWDGAGDDNADWFSAELAASALDSGKIRFSSELDDGCRRRGIASCMAIPLFANHRRWGVLSLYSRQADLFDAFYRERASEIGNEIGFGVERLVNAQELYRLARTNPLTGLPSRLYFEERVAALAAEQVRGTVLLININRFDEISSAYGNSAAIDLMRAIAQRLNLEVAERMALSHIGIGRFALFFHADEASTPLAFLRDIVMPLLQCAYQIDGHKIWCTINAGAAALPEDGTSCDALLVKAWDALASARDKNERFGFYDRHVDQALARELSLEAELRDAIARMEFVNYYQPKIDLKTGKLAGAEALIRWKHPTRGIVEPLEFVPVLERSGLVIAAGRQVMEQAMHDWRAWHDAGLSPPQIAVNVAPAQLRCDTLTGDIERVLAAVPPQLQPLSIEITESSLVSDHARVVEILSRIRKLGVPIAIDDFGTGYSSLAYLVTLPVDVLKIDRSFVMKMTHDAGYMGLVNTIVSLAHNLDLTVVAEGIETEEEAKLLRLLRCEQGQGYLYSRPIPAAQFAALLAKDS
ncbi:MAG: EAL domain-containing protein [Pseudomonadota bacterium]